MSVLFVSGRTIPFGEMIWTVCAAQTLSVCAKPEKIIKISAHVNGVLFLLYANQKQPNFP